MLKLNLSTVLLSLPILLGVLLIIYYVAVRPAMKTWGLTETEKTLALPGDELVPNPRWGFKQGITIQAPPEAIWPWLVQMGYQRAGWYSVDAIEAAIGAGDFVDGHSSNRIVPELQNLKVGDVIKIAKPLPYTVAMLDPNRVMVLHVAVNTKTNQPLDLNQPLPADYLNSSWTFYLVPVDASTTRLIVRFVFDSPPALMYKIAFGLFTDGGGLIMSPAQLKGIKTRAEKMYQVGK